MNKKKLLIIFFIFIIYKIFNNRIGVFLRDKLINSVNGELDFSSHFVLFYTTENKKIKNIRGFFAIDENGIHYVTNFLNPSIIFLPFSKIKRVELTQIVEEISLPSRAIHIGMDNKNELYFFLLKGNVRKAFDLIKKRLGKKI